MQEHLEAEKEGKTETGKTDEDIVVDLEAHLEEAKNHRADLQTQLDSDILTLENL